PLARRRAQPRARRRRDRGGGAHGAAGVARGRVPGPDRRQRGGQPMIRDVTAELLVLRKRAATWILLGIWTALGVFFAYVIPYAPDPGDSPAQLRDFLPQSLTGTLLEGFPFFGGVFALMLGVFALGSEYSWGTLTTLLTQRSGRTRVLASKLLALGVVLFG